MEKNNIYIGNRYVPIFANPVEWDNLREYEPLTIVTYNGTAYTSKQRVPVGTALNNKEYWVVTGNYNQQVEIYRQETEAVKDSLVGVNTDIKNLKANDANTNKRVDELDSKVTTLDGKIIELTEMVVVGDSYMTGYQPAGGNIGKPIPNIVASSLGLTLHNYATNASGYTKGGDAGTTFYQQVVNASNDKAFENDKVKYVAFIGGRNDYADTISPNGIATAIQQCATYSANNFTNAEILFIPLWDFNRPTKNIINCISDVAGYPLGIGGNGKIRTSPDLALSYIGRSELFYNGTDIHPNQNGANHFAKNITSFILGGSPLIINAIDNYTGDWEFYDIACEIRNGCAFIAGTVKKGALPVDGDIILTTKPNMRPRNRLWSIGFNTNGDGITLFALEPSGELKIWKNLTGTHSSTSNYGFNFSFPI